MALEHTRSHAPTPLSTDWMGAGTRRGKETQHQIDVFDADGNPHLRPKPNGPNATMRPQTVGLYERSEQPRSLWRMYDLAAEAHCFKLTWLVLGGDLAARSHRVEQLTAL